MESRGQKTGGVLTLLDLPEETLNEVLFSGYFRHRMEMICLMRLVCKQFRCLGFNSILHWRPGHNQWDAVIPQLPSLAGLSFEFSDLRFSHASLESLLPLKRKLLFLDFRGTYFHESCLETICQLENLTYLRLSYLYTPITDFGGRCIAALRKLQYLDLSGSEVTDQTIMLLCDDTTEPDSESIISSSRPLTHLVLNNCHHLTNQSIAHMTSLPLKSLSISHCRGLTTQAIAELANPR